MKENSHSRWSLLTLVLVSAGTLACVSGNDNYHTTATSHVSPPPRQVLTLVSGPSAQVTPAMPLGSVDPSADQREPLLIFNLQNGATFPAGQAVPLDFTVRNARLKDEGGAFRVRYIVDDGEMNWIDGWKPIWLAGWVPGEHTIRIELVGPDGWPYRNGNANVITRKFTVTN